MISYYLGGTDKHLQSNTMLLNISRKKMQDGSFRILRLYITTMTLFHVLHSPPRS